MTGDVDELDVLKVVVKEFQKLPDEAAQQRVLNYVCDRLKLTVQAKKPAGEKKKPDVSGDDEDEDSGGDQGGGVGQYASIAKLFEAAAPASGPDRALVAGYWFQYCQSAEDFTGKQINDALKKMGVPLSNVTFTFTSLIGKKPKLVMQSGKIGSRNKKYALTEAGRTAVEKMIKKTPTE